MKVELSGELLARVSELVARTMGLYFPREKWAELQRGIAAAAGELGFEGDPEGCAAWLGGGALSRRQVEMLAAHLTVGETYFFRERRHFDFLTQRILPELIHKAGTERSLRLWSAGCCTGEETYSLAIAVQRAIPDWERWQVNILGTDINPNFLNKARAGVFGAWSFRDAPEWLKGQYFRMVSEGRWEILPEIKRMVRFVPLNLAEDAYPSVLNDTQGMDVVFCRNVLMYFAPAEARRVLEKLYSSEREGGWLFVGSSELLHLSSSFYRTVSEPDVVVYRKQRKGAAHAVPPTAPVTHVEPLVEKVLPVEVVEIPSTPVSAAPDPREVAAELHAEGRYEEAAEILRAWVAATDFVDSEALGLLARCLANQGELTEALAFCERAIAADKCNASHQYVRAMILQERGSLEEAMIALRSVLYLDPQFALAHVALGTMARDRGQVSTAAKHLQNALKLLDGQKPDALLPDSEGITAGQLSHMIHSLLQEAATT